MTFVHDEFKDYLMKIADELQRDNYRRVIKKHLELPLDEDVSEKIVTACERLISVLKGKFDKEFIDEYHKRIEDRKRIIKKYGKDLVSRWDAIKYTGHKESTFDKKVRNKDNNIIITYRNGKPYFKLDDLRKIMKLELEPTKLALCINTHYQFDHERDGFIPFSGGEYYKILDENEKFVLLYNERWKAIISMKRQEFEVGFRVEEQINQMIQAQEENKQGLTKYASKELPKDFSIREIAQKLHVSEQTIRNWIKSGEIKYQRTGGSIRISHEDISGVSLKFNRNLATCMEDNTYIDKETREVVPFEKDKIYKIISENKIWITLYSVNCEKAARFSRKKFEKYFRNAEDSEIDRIHYKFDDLS